MLSFLVNNFQFMSVIYFWNKYIYFNSIFNIANIQTFKIELEGDIFLLTFSILITLTLSLFYFVFGLWNKIEWIPAIRDDQRYLIKTMNVWDLIRVHLDIAVFVCVFTEGWEGCADLQVYRHHWLLSSCNDRTTYSLFIWRERIMLILHCFVSFRKHKQDYKLSFIVTAYHHLHPINDE